MGASNHVIDCFGKLILAEGEARHGSVEDVLDINGEILAVDCDILDVNGDTLAVDAEILEVNSDILAVDVEILAVNSDILAVDPEILAVDGDILDDGRDDFDDADDKIGGNVVE